MDIPNITIDLSYFYKFLNTSSPFEAMMVFFLSGGWVIFLYIFLWGFWHLWIEMRQTQFLAAQKSILLAIDVPKMTEQSPMAVEQVFATLNGALSSFDNYEKYWLGKVQTTFSFEVVSIEGYVQFYIRCWSRYRDVIESSIYAQYPEAEITEVEDYTQAVPKYFPEEGWDLFGTEFVLANPSPYPIRTYTQFEHGLSGELKDPMAALLEGLAKLKQGEQVWIQLLIQPNDGKALKAEGTKLYKKLIGIKESPKQTWTDKVLEIPIKTIEQLTTFSTEVKKESKNEPPSLMQHLSPGEKTVVENIQMKLAKIAFKSKMRIIYVGKKEAFSKARTVSTLKGVYGQFTILDQNGFKPYGNVTTKSDYIWQTDKKFEYLTLFYLNTLTTRQNAILAAYRDRSMSVGAPAYYLNIEELATIYHFPVVTVKAPLLKKTEAKKGEPPFTLPVSSRSTFAPPPTPIKPPITEKAAPPKSIPQIPIEPPTAAETPKNNIEENISQVSTPPSNLPFA